MKKLLENFFSSGWEFTSSELDLRSKIQMINISLLLSAFGLMFGIISNIAHDNSELLLIELIILSINLAIFFILRKKRELTDSIAN